MFKVGQNVNMLGKTGIVIGFSEKRSLALLGIDEDPEGKLDPAVWFEKDNAVCWCPGRPTLQAGSQEWSYNSVSGGTKVLVKDNLPGVVIASNTRKRWCLILFKENNMWQTDWFDQKRYEITDEDIVLVSNEFRISRPIVVVPAVVRPMFPDRVPEGAYVLPAQTLADTVKEPRELKVGDFVKVNHSVFGVEPETVGFVVGFFIGDGKVGRKNNDDSVAVALADGKFVWFSQTLVEKIPNKKARVMVGKLTKEKE